jgi:hypothetical protein
MEAYGKHGRVVLDVMLLENIKRPQRFLDNGEGWRPETHYLLLNAHRSQRLQRFRQILLKLNGSDLGQQKMLIAVKRYFMTSSRDIGHEVWRSLRNPTQNEERGASIMLFQQI